MEGQGKREAKAAEQGGHANVCKQRKLPNGIFHMSDICIKPSKQTRSSVLGPPELWALCCDHFV